ncbi:hypothetical protein ACM01_12350 [Streptomyces viridochromogenes]|uniref:DUF7683 domain-containing protein n=1 Tax=Streptomyces viridochromogenes TaxID=1938 RepID=A0A0J7ZH18_STRVR|nr:hypothetical protein [Streptomyces viridochromogenes]KMS74717.1 hypothetical protein ACM01_12350 [Streptomyces viridochromogenes]KOG14775.1 hypothetical protein ADK36_29895 [Streptomyces viridochromogenes]KOG14969.1 hypothetical protein ADK35_29540 [Streptomyces viridochromogenes]
MTVYFLIVRYLKDEERPDATTDVTEVGGEAFGELLGMPPEQLADVYPLTHKHAERVRQLTGITLDLETYDYFLETEAD